MSDSDARIAMIVAAAENGVIGRNNQLPWKLPGDLPYFRKVTWGKPVIMGRKTYESLGRPLPGRSNIVITRSEGFEAGPEVKIVNNIDKAFKVAQAIAHLDGVDEVMVIGGAEIYRECLDVTDKLYLTEVHAEVNGDAFFPSLDKNQWKEVSRVAGENNDENPYEFSFVVLERIIDK